eukprot:4672818-Lingulodinium_polyedra.AAC.1
MPATALERIHRVRPGRWRTAPRAPRCQPGVSSTRIAPWWIGTHHTGAPEAFICNNRRRRAN